MYRVIKDPLKYFENITKDEKPYNNFSILGVDCLIINDHKAIEYVFRNNDDNFIKSKFHKGLQPLLGKGIFLSEDELWRKQRRETAPFFSGKYFPDYIRKMNISADLMIERIKAKAAKGEAIDADAEFMWFTLDVVLRALFKQKEESYAETLKNELGLLLQDAENRIWSLVSTPSAIKKYVSKDYYKALKFLHDLIEDIIHTETEEDNDFVSVLRQNYDVLNPQEKSIFQDQIMSFLLAGHETSANALAWCMYEIAKDKTLMRKTIEASKSVKTDSLTPQNFADLTFIQSIFEESMRLYPPVWTMSRQTKAEDIIPLSNGESLPIKKNKIIMICPYTLHRQNRYWDNPLQFIPARFSRENKPNIVPHSYIPFGGGPRLCMGHKFAIFEGIIALIKIFQNFEIECENLDHIRPMPLITLRPSEALKIKFYPLEDINQQKVVGLR